MPRDFRRVWREASPARVIVAAPAWLDKVGA
jgi:hypothetical protein